MLCDDLGDPVLGRGPKVLEVVEHLLTRVGAYRHAAALGELHCLAIERSDAGRAARTGLAGVLEDEHIGGMQSDKRIDMLEAARRPIPALQLRRSPVDRRTPAF